MSQAKPHRTRDPDLVTIVVPAKNEEEAIAGTLDALPIRTLHTMGLETEVYVLDGNSDDRTPEIARDWGATVVPDREDGKGAAFRNARDRFDGRFVVMLDADGTYAPDAIPRVLQPLLQDEADVVMGDRQILPGAMKATHRAGNALLSLEASVLYTRTCPDLCTGLWGFTGDVLASLPLQSSGFELEAELFALTSRLDVRTERVTVDYLPRDGETKLEGRRDGWRIAWWLLRSRVAPIDARGIDGPRATPELARRRRRSSLPVSKEGRR